MSKYGLYHLYQIRILQCRQHGEVIDHYGSINPYSRLIDYTVRHWIVSAGKYSYTGNHCHQARVEPDRQAQQGYTPHSSRGRDMRLEMARL